MVRPFPFELLSRWSREEARLTRTVARSLQPRVSLPRERALLDERWRSLLGGLPDAWPLAPCVLSREELRRQREGTVFVLVFRHSALGRLAVVLDAPFGVAIADAALGATKPTALALADALTPEREGALALLSAQASALLAPSPPPVWLSASDRMDDAVAIVTGPNAVCWRWQVACGLYAGEAMLVLDPGALLRSSTDQTPCSVLPRFRSCRVLVELLVARERCTREEFEALRVGDVLLFEQAMRLNATGLEGAMWLRSGALDVPVERVAEKITIADEARWMASEQGGSAVREELAAALGVEVEVVLARAELPLGEIAAWRPGELVEFGTRLGEPVLVRAGGRVVARGELCEVEGAVGVRITELL